MVTTHVGSTPVVLVHIFIAVVVGVPVPGASSGLMTQTCTETHAVQIGRSVEKSSSAAEISHRATCTVRPLQSYTESRASGLTTGPCSPR